MHFSTAFSGHAYFYLLHLYLNKEPKALQSVLVVPEIFFDTRRLIGTGTIKPQCASITLGPTNEKNIYINYYVNLSDVRSTRQKHPALII
jgi:hypothetical protein